jgi:lipopolysaccharide transport system ATP-binding protein
MSSDVVIKVEGILKAYQIYEKPFDRLKQAIVFRAAGLLSRLSRRERGPAHRYYKEFLALRDISFEICRGETIGVIGTNGSGKSTLLQLICGTLAATSGTITVNGRIAALLELGAGFNPQFTGRQNAYLNGAILGLSEAQISSRMESIEAFADIGTFIDQPVQTYSSGMFVRLAFAVIAHVDADILIIDEALAVGDVFFNQKCMRFLREFKKRGTILFVSHDTGAVVNFCDRAIWLNKGLIVEEGLAKSVCEDYLAGRYGETQIVDRGIPIETTTEIEVLRSKSSDDKKFNSLVDQRKLFINNTKLRNDIEIFRFKDAERGFGTGGAHITSVQMRNNDDKPLAWIIGGEVVTILIEATVRQPVKQLIMGFFFKDRLGQVLFGENSHARYAESAMSASAGSTATARFTFRMPILPVGMYSADVAIADGTSDDHVQLDWKHDAIAIQSHSSSTSTGLVGVQMAQISLDVTDDCS